MFHEDVNRSKTEKFDRFRTSSPPSSPFVYFPVQLCHISLPVLALALLLPVPATVATLAPPERSYNVLMLTPVSTKSHRNVFMPLATELTKRGHKVTIVSNHPPEDGNPSITYIQHGLPYFREDTSDLFEIRDVPSNMLDFFTERLPLMARDFYDVPAVKKLYDRKDEFDLVILDNLCNEVALPFTYNKSSIAVAVIGLEPLHSAVMGNILNPAYVASGLRLFRIPLTFVERLHNLHLTIGLAIQWIHLAILPSTQGEISKRFPELPSLLEMERNQSLVLLNSHFSLSTPLPLVPAQIEVGGMHCRPGEPLPEDINAFVSGKETIIYFSLGSYVKGTSIPIHYQQLLLSAFRKLPYKVLWKFEEERKDLPKNVMVKRWMPQQDILAHPNVKLFISHCGMLATQEAMYHATPVLALPVSSDQPQNAQQLEANGMGRTLLWEELTEELVSDAIKELISNPSYQNNASRILATFKDQPQSPVERAVFWTEYVIRHSGAVHLRSPERDLSWVEVLHLDILLALHLLLFLVVWSIKKMLKFWFGSAPSRKINKKKRD